MMNEKDRALLETLKVLKDLHGEGFNLYREINTTILHLLLKNGVPIKALKD